METTRSERIKLGAFMLFCGVLICVFLGYVLKRYLSEQYDNYYTIFDTDVNGLFVDAKVKLNGIAVGKPGRRCVQGNARNTNQDWHSCRTYRRHEPHWRKAGDPLRRKFQ